MTEEEIMIRAREAVVEVAPITVPDADIRAGHCDGDSYIRCVVRALRDLSKPLSEIQPVDPDKEEAIRLRNEAQWNDSPYHVEVLMKAIKRGRELERGQ